MVSSVRALVAVVAVVAFLAVGACAACQGGGTGGTGSASGAPVDPTGPTGPTANDAIGPPAMPNSADAAVAGGEPDARPKSDEPEVADPGRVIAELGAIPAWQAVIDRAQLLGRRGQHGVVYGRVGPALLVPGPAPTPANAGVPGGVPGAVPTDAGGVPTDAGGVPSDAGRAPTDAVVAPGAAPGAGLVKSPYVWLVDDTEGNGTLGIRIAVGDKAKEGDRIAAGGAWQLDAERRWFWKPDAVQPLPPAAPSDLKEPQAPVPTHAIATGELPSGARTISVARDHDAVYFQIVGPAPATDGDGWLVADQLGSPAVALMNLPGERPSYGGQDMRASDERWQLRRGQTYWVRIGKLRKRGADKPALVNARTAPVRVL
jgi:hypothetical protein